MKEDMRHIGRETKRILGEQIVTGKATFVADNHLPGMKYGKVLRSPYAFARIVNVDASEALAMNGVEAVVTWKDVDRGLSINNGFTPPRHPNLMDEYVRYLGDAVALIVADTEDLAMEAMEKIHVEYEVLKPVLSIDEALAEGAPQLYKQFPGNIVPHALNLNFGVAGKKEYCRGHLEDKEEIDRTIDEAFASSDVVVEVDGLLKSGQNPLPLEAPTTIGWWEDGVINFIASAAAPAYCHQNVASSLNLPYENVRLIVNAVGGSFGSKLYSGNVQCLVLTALMAKAAKCPVLYTYSKEEHFTSHQNRMITKGHVKLGMMKDGTVTAIDMTQWADAGSTASTQEFMLAVGTNTLPILCKTNNKRFNAEVVVTNHVPSGSFRGYGYLESTNLLTRAIFEACEKLELDPMTYLERNVLAYNEEFHNACAPYGHRFIRNQSSDWANLVRETAKACGWKDRWAGWGKPTWVSPDGKKRRGIGVCAAGHADTGGKQSNCNVTITGLGAVYVSTCMAEFGAGTRDIMQKIVAEELDMPLESVKMTAVDTAATPAEFGSTGSRSTYAGGICAKRAAEDARGKLFAICNQKFGIPVEDLGMKNGKVYQLSNPEKVFPLFPMLIGKVDSVTGIGHHSGVDDSTITHLQVIEVEVDTELGTIKLIDHFGGSDAGVIINPLPLRNQCQSFYAGTDIACFEETIWDKHNYRVLNPNQIEYKTRTFNEVVKHDHIILETNKGKDTRYPFGANGVGEPLLAPGGPAIRMAVYNACGIKLNDYPFTPDKVLAALKEKEGN
ncbi:MAG: xanthine dehydrogenase family protein molybdopterin-binding subunit [Clostridia bacterium]|nr:xanthine dehydrogenase family protein molybdopterin-binding subunit [Clostridia bacterium]